MVFDELPPKKNERRRICRRLEICIFVLFRREGLAAHGRRGRTRAPEIPNVSWKYTFPPLPVHIYAVEF